jgi:hypothetical protein
MRFRRGARLDTGQVTDVRGRRMGPGGLAAGGGGIGLVGLVIYLLISLLSSSGGGLGQLAPLAGQRVGRGDTARSHPSTADIRHLARVEAGPPSKTHHASLASANGLPNSNRTLESRGERSHREVHE